ncbi:hypothetical protein E2C01_008540 [Portunus trituberculatus]|uniref:Uncharacterized protein n=1 Tax=Portunus trituberculatus TaxID=210409 RepID=A0A5B7D229_PORTR|nr:hypothetical protein [Portunus trituberculatus]
MMIIQGVVSAEDDGHNDNCWSRASAVMMLCSLDSPHLPASITISSYCNLVYPRPPRATKEASSRQQHQQCDEGGRYFSRTSPTRLVSLRRHALLDTAWSLKEEEEE